MKGHNLILLVIIALLLLPTTIFAEETQLEVQEKEIEEAEEEYLQVYRVESGDNLYSLASEFETSIDELISLNPIEKPDHLLEGQVMVVPGRVTEEYTIESGDTLSQIAEDYEVDMDMLAEYNNLKDEDILISGQTLEIPLTHPSYEMNDGYSNWYPQNNWENLYNFGEEADKQIALTFDDGPDDYYTDEVLDILDEYQIPSTFYFVGNQIENYPEVVERTDSEGHEIGNHSWDHSNFLDLESEEIEEQVLKTEEAIKEITGNRTATFRPPYGALDTQGIAQLAEMDYNVINWSVDSWDWLDKHPDLFHINVLPNVDSGSIILMHSYSSGEDDNRDHLLEALPELIETLKSQGYEFVTVSELLNVNSYK
ncbi:polysaccharide deacetylase family protein [Natranaerobius thermophilus]|uniref:Polysaccharide deacetylase n=1 Tax=Natranaerobius thermophilus (strain ATCC BAA-1301 / DSM 18059 / JW/NM-WN-LF) TaxID=457570 RepID=B2A740_NATTJ|nr:polysaccharide deacetylase family protein [Natranaerobius thermophilus]ACB85631.1 polysaccharide deacetylase [Natranaerobius thermophilus JW/NM-WN-LF]